MFEQKPKLTPEQLVTKMKEEKGITFNHMSELEAIDFLSTKNNYYRLSAYRKNYDKKQTGPDKGKYVDLDFACLVDLSIIDMRFRRILFQMCLDIEHSLKVSLLRDITENDAEDGYEIVKNFIDQNDLYGEIISKQSSSYVGDLVQKFFSPELLTGKSKQVDFIHCPIWAFVEIISFGPFSNLYNLYYIQKGENAPVGKNLINPIRNLRNACAHNNCIINNLRKGNTIPSPAITKFVKKLAPSLSHDSRRNLLSSKPIYEISCLLFVYDRIVSKNVKNHRYAELLELVNVRMQKHKEYYETQQIITSRYNFIREIVNNLHH